MRASEAPGKDETIRHIDKMGVKRVLKRGNTHVFEKHKETTSQSIVKALNSIMAVAPKKAEESKTNAISQNGFFMVFDGDIMVTCFKPSKGLEKYFKEQSVMQKREIIKRWWQK